MKTKKPYFSVCPICKAKKPNALKPEYRVCKKCKNKTKGEVV